MQKKFYNIIVVFMISLSQQIYTVKENHAEINKKIKKAATEFKENKNLPKNKHEYLANLLKKYLNEEELYQFEKFQIQKSLASPKRRNELMQTINQGSTNSLIHPEKHFQLVVDIQKKLLHECTLTNDMNKRSKKTTQIAFLEPLHIIARLRSELFKINSEEETNNQKATRRKLEEESNRKKLKNDMTSTIKTTEETVKSIIYQTKYEMHSEEMEKYAKPTRCNATKLQQIKIN